MGTVDFTSPRTLRVLGLQKLLFPFIFRGNVSILGPILFCGCINSMGFKNSVNCIQNFYWLLLTLYSLGLITHSSFWRIFWKKGSSWEWNFFAVYFFKMFWLRSLKWVSCRHACKIVKKIYNQKIVKNSMLRSLERGKT